MDTGEVDIYTSMTSTGQIQMVLTDKESGSSNGQKAITLGLQIMTDIQNGKHQGLITLICKHRNLLSTEKCCLAETGYLPKLCSVYIVVTGTQLGFCLAKIINFGFYPYTDMC